jgi:dipeptidase E
MVSQRQRDHRSSDDPRTLTKDRGATMKQIIAIGSGGLDHKNPLLDLYIIAQSPVPNPKICLLSTPSGDHPGLIEYFEKFYGQFPCKPSHLSLFNPDPKIKDIRAYLLSHDIIFVSGGHTKCALVLWEHYEIDDVLRDAYDAGIILAGGSAGSVCWFDECITDSVPGTLSVMSCLGILPFSNCPHYTSEHRQAAYKHYFEQGTIENGYAIDDDAALHFVDGQVLRSVSAIESRASYDCRSMNNEFVQSKIDTRYLGDDDAMQELIWNSISVKAIGELK